MSLRGFASGTPGKVVRKNPAREAGASIKPRGGARLCERNPRYTCLKKFPAREAGGRQLIRSTRRRESMSVRVRCRPLRGLQLLIAFGDPGVALAKPHSTPGYILSLASRAERYRYHLIRFARLQYAWRTL
jgi:hypothetical protein